MGDLVRAALAGDLARARALQVEINELNTTLFVEPNPVPVKAALHLLGHFADEMRLPLTPATEATRTRLANALRGLGLLG
jgi:4-hydroxy-tetrahydrodipicolinate synthase